MAKTLIEHSKIEYHNGKDTASNEDIQTGCLQRIATATEAMAVNHIQLQSNYDRLKRSQEWYQERYYKAERRISALKGVITKLKKRKP